MPTSAGTRKSKAPIAGHSLRCGVIFISPPCMRSNSMWGTAFRQPVLPGISFQLIHYQEPGRRTKGAARFGCADVAQLQVACGSSAGSTTVYCFPASELQNAFRNEVSFLNFSLLHELPLHRTL